MRKFLLGVFLYFIFIASEAIAQGNGFELSNLSWQNSPMGVTLLGEIKNNSGKSYDTTIFGIAAYDESGKLLDRLQVAINDFKVGAVESFKAMGTTALPSKVSFRIKLDIGM